MAATTRRIPIPASRRVQLFCQGVLPVLVFVGAAGAAFWMMRQDMAANGISGELFSRRTEVYSPIAGVLIPIKGKNLIEFTKVNKGEVIAQLDPEPLKAQLRSVQATLESVQAQLESERATTEWEHATAISGQAADEGQLHAEVTRWKIELAKIETELAVSEQSLKWSTVQCDILQKLVDEKIIPEYQLNEWRKTRNESLAAKLKHQATLEVIKSELAKAQAALAKIPPLPVPKNNAERESLFAKLLAPLNKQIEVQRALREQLEAQIDQLTIKAPFSGMITSVMAHPGQAVGTGTPIFTMAADESPYVLAYVRPQQQLRPEVGMGAEVRFWQGGHRVAGRIVRIGPEVTDVSLRQLVDPRIPEFGLPIAIELQWPGDLKGKVNPHPGELVSVQLHPTDIDRTVKTAENVTIQQGQLVLATTP